MMATIVSAISKSQHCSFHLLSYICQEIIIHAVGNFAFTVVVEQYSTMGL